MENDSPSTAIVTGSSGLLGRSVVIMLKTSFQNVIQLGFSRAKDQIVKLDLTDNKLTNEFFDKKKPTHVFHCAAERRPDVCQDNPSLAIKLNQETTLNLAKWANDNGAFFIYISTDYIFDGTTPPYNVTDKPNPLNFYGQTKLKGEQCLQSNPSGVVLRVPVLFGKTEYDNESAVNCLLPIVKDPLQKKKMDNFQKRYPTCVRDVSRVIRDIALKWTLENEVKGVAHFSSTTMLTKYQMCEVFGKIYGVGIDHLEKVDKAVGGMVDRPLDAHLTNDKLIEWGIDCRTIELEDFFMILQK